MRKAAIEILEDEMSEYTLEHIRKIDYLEEWIVDAMIKFHESEVKKLNKLDVNRRGEQLSCGRNITTCVFYKDGGKCSSLEYCRDQTT